jgi:hypothetical protein
VTAWLAEICGASFAEATSRHIVAEDDLKRALLEHDHSAVKALHWQTTAAHEQKAKLRRAIRQHNTEAHGANPRSVLPRK